LPKNPDDYCLAEFLRAGQKIDMGLHVLYEDNHIIAVYKPTGVLVQADDTGDATLCDEVKYYLKQKYHKLGKVFLGVVHRLDRPVSGIVLFGKTSKGAARLSEQIRNHTIKKTYHALVIGTPLPNAGTLINFLKKDEIKNVVMVFDHETPDTLRAELDYETVKKVGDNAIIKINLKTGRSHQIRAQLAHLGHPIVGDVKYEPRHSPKSLKEGVETKANSHHSIALCATSVEFKLATKDEIKKIEIEIPQEWKII